MKKQSKSKIHASKEMFDLAPLERKKNRHLQQQYLKYFLIYSRKKLMHALSLCLSSYIQSQDESSSQQKRHHRRSKTKRQATLNSSFSSTKMIKNVHNEKKIQVQGKIVKMTEAVQQNICDLVNSVFQMFRKAQDTNLQTTRTKQEEKKVQLLTESNKNFIIEILIESNLLRTYRGVDRTFSKLVDEAQKNYYTLQNYLEQSRISLHQDVKKIQRKDKSQNLQPNIMKDAIQQNFYETASSFFSMKKRFLQAQKKIPCVKKNLEREEKIRGYETPLSQERNEMMLDLRNKSQKFDDDVKHQIPSKLYFTQRQHPNNKTPKQVQCNQQSTEKHQLPPQFFKLILNLDDIHNLGRDNQNQDPK